jgi:hypothetical protein
MAGRERGFEDIAVKTAGASGDQPDFGHDGNSVSPSDGLLMDGLAACAQRLGRDDNLVAGDVEILERLAEGFSQCHPPGKRLQCRRN